ncbi:hypothetical protein ACLQ20_30260 [Micromonospora sp. DT46]|uniref:hypothetical protein n=1 Tax=unclassified Micromonospora TaxID=2617518 RepID=UPI001788CF53|nr:MULTISPECIES: hypothetical protein [unclassified Micromonospora]WSG02125.1 hypothetical protein OG989_31640 [Micromonospora sp. NBC_01740]
MWVRTRAVVAGGVVLVVLVAVGIWIVIRQMGGQLRLPLASRTCTVQADGRVALDPDQMANAATIAAIGIQRKMPERAVVVALATAYQESGLRNLAGGDRDSVGLFQQRPSQGWGTPEQIRDPRYAARKFYAGLKKVRGWEQMRVTDAAQKVQRSAFPEAYEKWADESEVLTRALVGHATGAVACTVGRDPAMRGEAAATALTRGLSLDWGLAGATTAADLTGLTVPAADELRGWRYAHWLVSHAQDHGVKRVRFGDLEWTARDGTWNRTDDTPATGRVVAEVFAEA